MALDLRGKRALVTGGAVRIGKVICEHLAQAGCDVAIHYRDSADAATSLAGSLRDGGVQACTLQADLGDVTATAALIPAAVDALGGIDLLVNNASVFHKQALLDASAADLEDEVRVNAFAPILLMRAFALWHRDREGTGWPQGRIVNLLDRRVAGYAPGAFPYQLSKNMLRDATRLAALELGPGISVNAVAPGPILPPPGEGAAYLAERAGPMVLAERPGPAQVADAVLFLLATEGITGQVLYVDSGQHLL